MNLTIEVDDVLRVETRGGVQGNWENRFAGDLRACLKYFNGMGLGKDGCSKRLVVVRAGGVREVASATRVNAETPLICAFEGFALARVRVGDKVHDGKLFDAGDEVRLELDLEAQEAEAGMTMRKAMGLPPATSAELAETEPATSEEPLDEATS